MHVVTVRRDRTQWLVGIPVSLARELKFHELRHLAIETTPDGGLRLSRLEDYLARARRTKTPRSSSDSGPRKTSPTDD